MITSSDYVERAAAIDAALAKPGARERLEAAVRDEADRLRERWSGAGGDGAAALDICWRARRALPPKEVAPTCTIREFRDRVRRAIGPEVWAEMEDAARDEQRRRRRAELRSLWGVAGRGRAAR